MPERVSRRLIVNADDFGQSEGINRGIIQAHDRGIVTSASLMVRWPAAAAAAAWAREHPQFSVGLHIDLGEWAFRAGEWTPLYQVVELDDTESVAGEVDRQFLDVRTRAGTGDRDAEPSGGADGARRVRHHALLLQRTGRSRHMSTQPPTIALLDWAHLSEDAMGQRAVARLVIASSESGV